jgi:hypothetical protein
LSFFIRIAKYSPAGPPPIHTMRMSGLLRCPLRPGLAALPNAAVV